LGCRICRFESAASAGGEGLQRGCLLKSFTVAADKSAEGGVEPAVAVEVARQLSHQFPGLVLLFLRRRCLG
jgi:hypothetical protein